MKKAFTLVSICGFIVATLYWRTFPRDLLGHFAKLQADGEEGGIH